MNLFVDGQPIGLIRHNGFVVYNSLPGSYQISAMSRWDDGLPPPPLDVQLTQGKVTYIRYNPKFEQTRIVAACGENEEILRVCWRYTDIPAFETVQESLALSELGDLKQSQ